MSAVNRRLAPAAAWRSRRWVALLAAVAAIVAGCGAHPLSRTPSSATTSPRVALTSVTGSPRASSPVLSSPAPVESGITTESGGASVNINSLDLSQWGTAGCPDSTKTLQQSVTGQFSGCLQVGAVPPGVYRVSLEQILSGPRDAAPANAEIPGLHLSVSPTSGPPGTPMTITGSLATPLSSQPDHAQLCWDGCPDGLPYAGVELQWISPTIFRTTIVAPQAPWVAANPLGVAPFVSGDYSIGVQCLQQVTACGLGGAEASTSFQLHVTAPPSWCRTADSCAQLAVSSARALPGDDITVSGFAPLVLVEPNGQPFAGQLEVLPGRPAGNAVQFSTLTDAVAAYLGNGEVTVTSPPMIADVNSAGWTLAASGGWQPVTASPAMPSTTAWCADGAITIDADGATSTVSTLGVQGVLTSMGFPPLTGSVGSTCDTLALLGSGEGTTQAVAAGFGVEGPDQNPLDAEVALLTRDGGKTWTQIPAPHGAQPDRFGGFRYQGNDVAAVFATSENGPEGSYPAPTVESTDDGGRTWHAANLACPASGACITFGPLQPGNCAKDGAYQVVISSIDGGQHWLPVAALNEDTDGCWPAQLFAASDGSEVLVDDASPLVVQRSTDAGRTWRDIGFPPPTDVQLDGGGGAIIAVPGGSLLAVDNVTASPWQLLRPGASTWCDVRVPNTTNENVRFFVRVQAVIATLRRVLVMVS